MKNMLFACIGAVCLCASCVKYEKAREELEISRLKETIYQYQRICDKYIPEERFGDTVAESEEWDIITQLVDSPYNPCPKSDFWASYVIR